MRRRVCVEQVRLGAVRLSPTEAHHLRDVLRLEVGSAVELFDEGGAVGAGVLVIVGTEVVVDVQAVDQSTRRHVRLTLAGAVPKGPRADWMVEKLSELGVDRFVPLVSARSVVVPEGKNKLERWRRIATEAAKQSRRRGVMKVGDVARIDDVLAESGLTWVCTTEIAGTGAIEAMAQLTGSAAAERLESAGSADDLVVLIGPEGGWTSDELKLFRERGLTAVRLGTTILRVETAAVAVAAIVAAGTSVERS